MTSFKNEGTDLINRKKSPKTTQWKGKTREEKRHQAMLNKIKKWQKDDSSYL
ncbi:hypothetical protein SAMN04487943_10471 [Gracilibacillus orientalis]|uniref:Uncharacterized protein n=1 Tax=Gracilibacillus orientalis TaxID=334253 RepID=A0A1I4KP14_9BACI|nr:hypothetical protein [Gracilibacillus orientalis]SFL80508.1 hypothetical protein SAMN04487943_10471 [Gracilibacillus orientalis]